MREGKEGLLWAGTSSQEGFMRNWMKAGRVGSLGKGRKEGLPGVSRERNVKVAI